MFIGSHQSDFVGFVALVELLEEGSGWARTVQFLGPHVLKSVDAVVSEGALGGHQILVQVARLRQMPLSVMQQFVPDLHLLVDAVDIGHVGVGSEVVSHEHLGLLGGGSVGTGSAEEYISWILMR